MTMKSASSPTVGKLSGMIYLTQIRIKDDGKLESCSFFLAVSDISSLMHRKVDGMNRPFKHTLVKLKSGGVWVVQETVKEIMNAMAEAF